jgi:hypothetical protein
MVSMFTSSEAWTNALLASSISCTTPDKQAARALDAGAVARDDAGLPDLDIDIEIRRRIAAISPSSVVAPPAAPSALPAD